MAGDDPYPVSTARFSSGRGAAVFGAALAGAAILAAAFLLDGSRLWLLPIAALAIVASAVVVGAGPHERPLTAAGRTNERLAHVDAVLANIPDPVILVDRRAVVLEANAAARRLLAGIREG